MKSEFLYHFTDLLFTLTLITSIIVGAISGFMHYHYMTQTLEEKINRWQKLDLFTYKRGAYDQSLAESQTQAELKIDRYGLKIDAASHAMKIALIMISVYLLLFFFIEAKVPFA